MTTGDTIVFFVVLIIGAALTQVFIASRLIQRLHPTSVNDGLVRKMRYSLLNKVFMAVYVLAFVAIAMLLRHY